jgi:hypothetical protein
VHARLRQNMTKLFHGRKLAAERMAVENKWKLECELPKGGKWVTRTV